MRVVYIANDGKEFDDKYDCENYEWKLNHPGINEIHMYDNYDDEQEDIFSMSVYENVVKIIVPNEESVKDLQELGDYTGYTCYEWIDEPGEWIWDDEELKFVKAK